MVISYDELRCNDGGEIEDLRLDWSAIVGLITQSLSTCTLDAPFLTLWWSPTLLLYQRI